MYGDEHRHDPMSRWYIGPAPKKRKPRKITGYQVLYGGSAQEDSRRSPRLYTREAADRLAARLERRGVPAYVEPLHLYGDLTLTKFKSFGRKRHTRHSRSR